MTNSVCQSTMVRSLPAIDARRPVETRLAVFAAGCFWVPEARFGGLAGVLETRVGFCGGRHPHPDYHRLVDHREAVEIRYDPARISYRDLLEVFWHLHDPSSPGVLLRFAPGLFYRTAEEGRLARETAQERHGEDGTPVRTDIERLGRFHPAAASHQKHYLRGTREIMSEFREMFEDPECFVASTAAARVNAVLAGQACPETIRAEIDSYGLSRTAQATVLAQV